MKSGEYVNSKFQRPPSCVQTRTHALVGTSAMAARLLRWQSQLLATESVEPWRLKMLSVLSQSPLTPGSPGRRAVLRRGSVAMCMRSAHQTCISAPLQDAGESLFRCCAQNWEEREVAEKRKCVRFKVPSYIQTVWKQREGKQISISLAYIWTL